MMRLLESFRVKRGRDKSVMEFGVMTAFLRMVEQIMKKEPDTYVSFISIHEAILNDILVKKLRKTPCNGSE